MKRALSFAFLWAVLMSPVSAKDFELFVRNQPFEGDTRFVFNEIFAPLDALLDALGYSYLDFPDGHLWISVGEHRATPLPPIRKFHRLLLEGRSVSVSQQIYGERVYVNVEQLADALGARYKLNRQTHTADLLAPTLLPSQLEGVANGNPESGQSPLSLEKLQWSMGPEKAGTPSWGGGYLVVRNKSQADLRGAVLHLTLLDGAGRKVLGRLAQPILRLAPGARFTWQFPLWVNLLEPGAVVKVKVDWDYPSIQGGTARPPT